MWTSFHHAVEAAAQRAMVATPLELDPRHGYRGNLPMTAPAELAPVAERLAIARLLALARHGLSTSMTSIERQMREPQAQVENGTVNRRTRASSRSSSDTSSK
jgi:hypothetical protein